jgi:hypothetical protein
MKKSTLSASPAAIVALKKRTRELFKQPVVGSERVQKSEPDELKGETRKKRKTRAEIAIESAREGWIRAHNARLKMARRALRKRIATAQKAKQSRDDLTPMQHYGLIGGGTECPRRSRSEVDGA